MTGRDRHGIGWIAHQDAPVSNGRDCSSFPPAVPERRSVVAMKPGRRTVMSGTARLSAWTWGTTGPAVVALHPGVGDSRIWSSCAARWAAAGHSVVGYDRRGFGDTRCSPEPHDDLDDLLAVMNAASIESAVVVGNSRGGGLAIDLALAHPERVRGLVSQCLPLSRLASSTCPASTTSVVRWPRRCRRRRSSRFPHPRTAPNSTRPTESRV